MAASSSSSWSMEQQSTVDTTSPFRSVKEAIATYGYGHQLIRPPQTTQTQKPDEDRELDEDGAQHRHDHDDDGAAAAGGDFNEFGKKLKKMENELVETKLQLKLLNNKHSQTEVAIASLNAELHKSMSKIARMEANHAGNMNKHLSKSPILEPKGKDPTKIMEQERPTLDQVLSFGVCEGYFANSYKVAKKKKPIAPLITDIFVWKKSPTPKHKHKDDLAFLTQSFYSSSS